MKQSTSDGYMPDKKFVAYGHTFQNERDMISYGQNLAEKRARAKARKVDMTPREKEDAETRRHFAKENKHFKAR